MRGLYTSDKSSSEEEDELAQSHYSKPLKSGKVHTVDTQVLRHVSWPHEFVYMLDRQQAVCENLSVHAPVRQLVCQTVGCQ